MSFSDKWDNKEHNESWFDLGRLFRGSKLMRLFGTVVFFLGIAHLGMIFMWLTLSLFG